MSPSLFSNVYCTLVFFGYGYHDVGDPEMTQQVLSEISVVFSVSQSVCCLLLFGGVCSNVKAVQLISVSRYRIRMDYNNQSCTIIIIITNNPCWEGLWPMGCDSLTNLLKS